MANKDGPALRLVKTKTSAETNGWTYGRGASEVPTSPLLSAWNPYKSKLELWLEKTGQDLEKPDPADDTSPLYWAVPLESLVAAAYCRPAAPEAHLDAGQH